jgi:hypothetical protein
LSYTFTVRDKGRPVNVAYSCGTAFNFVNNTPNPGIQNFQTYIKSQQHMAAQAAATRATVILSNHSEFDNAVNKNRMIAGRGDGPHPYEVGADSVQRYFQVMQSCARAAQLKLEQQHAEASVSGFSRTWKEPMGEVVYRAEIPLTRQGPLRLAQLPTEPEPVRFGTHGAIARHYGITGEVPTACDDDRLCDRSDRWLTARYWGALEARRIVAAEIDSRLAHGRVREEGVLVIRHAFMSCSP